MLLVFDTFSSLKDLLKNKLSDASCLICILGQDIPASVFLSYFISFVEIYSNHFFMCVVYVSCVFSAHLP